MKASIVCSVILFGWFKIDDVKVLGHDLVKEATEKNDHNMQPIKVL